MALDAVGDVLEFREHRDDVPEFVSDDAVMPLADKSLTVLCDGFLFDVVGCRVGEQFREDVGNVVVLGVWNEAIPGAADKFVFIIAEDVLSGVVNACDIEVVSPFDRAER
ncbi:hypothetical protein LPA44_14550 [Halobacterium sp. KA-4]|nr:hypothetical protein [Halobacterium sp. KA-4]MCD2201100.1 hypothetical protein [Halobacterium sp. KA-4]